MCTQELPGFRVQGLGFRVVAFGCMFCFLLLLQTTLLERNCRSGSGEMMLTLDSKVIEPFGTLDFQFQGSRSM